LGQKRTLKQAQKRTLFRTVVMSALCRRHRPL
jgi:hypothetical protein